MPDNVVLMNPDDGPSPWLRATTIRADEPVPFYGNPAPDGSIPLTPGTCGTPEGWISAMGASMAIGAERPTPEQEKAYFLHLNAPMHQGTFIPAPHGAAIADALKSGHVFYGPGFSWSVVDGAIVLKRTPPPTIPKIS